LASTGVPAGGGGERFLPPDPRVEEPYLFTPKMALRVATLGAVALVVFAVLFLRLWSLQILSGAKYLAEAQNNQVRTVRLEAPRGPILDRHGNVLVTNVAGTAIEVWPDDLPKQGRYALLKRLAQVLNTPLPPLLKKIEARKGDPLTPVTAQVAVHDAQVNYLYEHRSEFPGVQIRQTYLRSYHSQALAAHELGYTGEISPAQLKRLRGQGYVAGDRIGQSGVELAFDRFLRGTPGLAQLHVDAQGRARSALELEQEPVPGDAVRLTIDISLQRAAERALQYGIKLARADKHWAANGGAMVALDPRNGEILAMASAPTYKPSVFVGRLDPQKLKPLLDPAAAQAANYPGLDRATAGLYPPGSTFKPVTALAAMSQRLVGPYEQIPCTPTFSVHGQEFKNWDPGANTQMTLMQALAASCDTVFYQLGYRFYGLPADQGHPLQAWAGRFGFGGPTGLDIGGEQAGLLPTPEWRQATYTKKTDPCCWEIDRIWKPGDSIQLAIGQKDLLVTPLQMARFYALIANGGSLVTPHVVAAVEQPEQAGGARAVRYLTPPAPRKVYDDPTALAVVRDGLYQATHASYGTSSSIFGNFPVPVCGKTGTAEKVVDQPGYHGLQDQSWWVGYAPCDSPQIVVAALIENGGHGGTAAAPAAAQVLAHYFGAKPPQIGVIKSD
jgi:penicillin-binding protein 2